MPILLCPLGALAHEDAPQYRPEEADRLTASAQLDVRAVQADSASTAALPLAGIGPLRQPDVLWGGSGLGLSGQKNLPADLQAQTVMSLRYSDQEQKILLDESWLGLAGHWGWIQAGRVDPLPALQPAAWPVANLLMQALLGDDHWHGDGALMGQGQASDPVHWRLGAFGANAYPGAQDKVWSLGGTVQLQPHWRLSGAVVAAPQLTRASVAAGAHTHSAAMEACGRTLACVDGQGGVGWLATQWDSGGAQPRWSLQAYLMQRLEQGQLRSPNGTAEYEGQVDGSLLELGYRPQANWHVALRHEFLSLRHDVQGTNLALIAQDAGLLDNAHSPQRLGVLLRWSLRPDWTLQGMVMHDQSRAEAQWISSVGVQWRPEGWRLP